MRRPRISTHFSAAVVIAGATLRGTLLGQITFERTYGGGGIDEGYCIRETQGGGYIIVGRTESFGSGGGDLYLIRTDSLGDTVWTRTLGGDGNDWGYDVQQTLDGGYVFAGFTGSFGAGGYDVYVIKTDENGLTGIEEQRSTLDVQRSTMLFQNHPNPLHQSTVISYSLKEPGEAMLEVYDVAGRLVETLANKTYQAGIHQVRWNRRDNPSGVHLYTLRAGDFTETRKMVVVD